MAFPPSICGKGNVSYHRQAIIALFPLPMSENCPPFHRRCPNTLFAGTAIAKPFDYTRTASSTQFQSSWPFRQRTR
ncbi:hypothetical protein BKA82DRAFT_1007486, partial [Pisolithus tinctorius]